MNSYDFDGSYRLPGNELNQPHEVFKQPKWVTSTAEDNGNFLARQQYIINAKLPRTEFNSPVISPSIKAKVQSLQNKLEFTYPVNHHQTQLDPKMIRKGVQERRNNNRLPPMFQKANSLAPGADELNLPVLSSQRQMRMYEESLQRILDSDLPNQNSGVNISIQNGPRNLINNT